MWAKNTTLLGTKFLSTILQKSFFLNERGLVRFCWPFLFWETDYTTLKCSVLLFWRYHQREIVFWPPCILCDEKGTPTSHFLPILPITWHYSSFIKIDQDLNVTHRHSVGYSTLVLYGCLVGGKSMKITRTEVGNLGWGQGLSQRPIRLSYRWAVFKNHIKWILSPPPEMHILSSFEYQVIKFVFLYTE